MRFRTIAFVLSLALAAAYLPAIAGDDNPWDTSHLGVSKDWSEPGANPKNKNAPTSRLKKLTECTECQSKVDRLQALLDAWYLAEYEEGAQLKQKGMANDSKEGSDQQKTGGDMQKEASAGLGGLSTADIKAKAKKAAAKPDPTIPADKAKLEQAIKDTAAELQRCLDDCKKKAAGETPPAKKPDDPKIGEGNKPPVEAECPAAEHVIELDFVVNRGADISAEDIDAALKKLNKTFEKSGIGFHRKTLTPVNDPKLPEFPKEGGENNASDDQKAVAKEAEKIAKGLPAPHGSVTVKVVENFQDPNRPNNQISSIQGITIGNTIVIVDPDHIRKNTLGSEDFAHTLAHELGHRLGLDHQALKSDKDYKHNDKGTYESPNVMAPGFSKTGEPDEFTQDQIDVIKKNAEKLYSATPKEACGPHKAVKKPSGKPKKRAAKRGEDDPLYMENFTPPPRTTKPRSRKTDSEIGTPHEPEDHETHDDGPSHDQPEIPIPH